MEQYLLYKVKNFCSSHLIVPQEEESGKYRQILFQGETFCLTISIALEEDAKPSKAGLPSASQRNISGALQAAFKQPGNTYLQGKRTTVVGIVYEGH